MKYEIFKTLLSNHNLTLKDFANKTKLSYSGCYKWKTSGIPPWVESWFELYEENQDLCEIKRLVSKVYRK